MNSKEIGSLAGTMLAANFATGCARLDAGADAQIVRELAARVQKLEDLSAIQKVQAKYAHYLFTQDFDRIYAECYAEDAPDVSVEFSDSGVYRGAESVKKLYAAFEATKAIPGFFILHMTVNRTSRSRPTGSRRAVTGSRSALPAATRTRVGFGVPTTSTT